MKSIEELLSNIEQVIELIRAFPQTYATILKEHKTNPTYQFILRRKLNIQLKMGNVCKMMIPGTRQSKVVFYTMPKSYTILVEANKLGSETYCFFSSARVTDKKIVVEELWILKDIEWKKIPKKEFYSDLVLKWI